MDRGIGTNLNVRGARLAGMGMGSCFSGHGQAWPIVIITINGVDIILVVDGGDTWGGLIWGLMLVVEVRCMPSRALGAARYAENN